MFEGIRFLNIEYFFNKIADLFAYIFGYLFGRTPSGTVDVYSRGSDGLLEVSRGAGQGYHMFLFLLGLGFVVTIIYYLYMSYEIRQQEVDHVNHWHAPDLHRAQATNPRLQRWEKVVGLFNSSDHTQWRLAIIEADTMLDELMEYLGFDGANLGERLKSSSVRVFPPLRDAWEVHNLRNRLAHEGLGYDLQQDEAMRARKIYENLFRGYNFI